MPKLNDQDILDFIRSSSAPVTKREIARAFHIKGGENRVALKQILKKLESEGIITKHPGGAYGVPSGLPGVCIVEVDDISIDGDVFAKPIDWNAELQGETPRIEIIPETKKGHTAMGMGERALVRLKRLDKTQYEGRVIKRLDNEKGRILGLLRNHKHGHVLQPTDKKAKYDFDVPHGDLGDARDGDLCLAEIQPSRGMRNKKVRIVEVIGRRDDPAAISLISLHEKGISNEFPAAVLKQTQQKDMAVPPIKGREDLRDIPLVTIDGADARDFDDAVFAEKCALADGSEGYHLIVAIADVSFYVRTETPLDNEAQKRGNSTYFPDRVVPMLPEVLSNDLCSLRPHEDRACMAAHLWINMDGQLVQYKFGRALMRSKERLVYEQVQAAYDGQTDDKTAPLMDTVINPLYDAYRILDAARAERGALDLDLPERQIIIDDNNNMVGVKQRVRLDAHKLIEEFMVLANVAAASALEDKKSPCVYRIHDAPSLDKLSSAGEFIESFGLSIPKGQKIKPKQLNGILRKASTLPFSHLISTVVLRCQSQAHYATDNIGHYGLALKKYAHFTSPIRRYADLMVHRSLVSAYGMGAGGLSEAEIAAMDEICERISSTERASMEAERNATDRFTAHFLSTQIGAQFEGRISGVTRFGLFVQLHESGADGLVPMRSLPQDYYIHDEEQHALIGRRSGRVFRMGADVTVRLIEADGLTGSTVLELVGHHKGADIPGFSLPKKPKQSNNRSGLSKKNLRKPRKSTIRKTRKSRKN